MSIWDRLPFLRNIKLSNRDDAETLRLAMGGGNSSSGKSVTAETVLSLSTAWSCVRLLAETIGTLPLGLYEKLDEDNRQPATGNDLYSILHDSPNAWQTAAEFWEGIVACVSLWGNGYAEKRTIGDRLVSLEPLRPDRMSVSRNSRGALEYRYGGGGQTKAQTFAADQVFHVRGFGVGGDIGLSTISYGRQTMGIALASEETAGKTFQNGLQFSGFLKIKKWGSKDQRKELVDMFDQFAGSSKTGKVMPLPEEADFVPLSIKPEDAQLLQSRAFNVEEICRWFRVPPFMVGHTEKSTSWGTGLEQQNIGFLTYALRPYLSRIEQAVKKQLIVPAERGRVYAEFNIEGLLRADSQGRAALYASYAQNGIDTRNSMRRKENLPPMDGGDILTVQSNLIPLASLERGDAPAPSDQLRSALMNMLFGGDLDRVIDERMKLLAPPALPAPVKD